MTDLKTPFFKKNPPRALIQIVATAALFSLSACGAAVTSERFGKKSAMGEGSSLNLNASTLPFRGVSLAGAEFGGNQLPGTYGTTYTYPTHAEVDAFVSKGMTVFRIPFLWERLQPQANQALDAAELARLDGIVSYATSKGASALIDPHNYARYYGQVIGTGVSNATFADFWTRLAQHYQSNSSVIFGLMNEPHDLPTEQWAAAAQAAINAIRATAAKNLIFVPGNAWTGAHSWTDNFYGTPNAVAMLEITDPANNFAFEVHQYLDFDFSGTNSNCVSTTIGSTSMAAFTSWLRTNGRRGFLGEFAGANNTTCLAAVDDMLKFLEKNSDVYLGWTWWAAGPWWGNYMFSIEPSDTANAPIMSLLSTHLGTSPAPAPAPAPAPGPAPAPAPAPTPTPPPPATSLTGTLSFISVWNNGYCASVAVTNTGANAVSEWTVQFDSKSSTVNQSWSTTLSHSGTIYTATPVSYNTNIAPGATITWGFCATMPTGGTKAVILSTN